MMILDNKYTLERDSTSWKLHFKEEGEINSKTGKPTTSLGTHYYPTLNRALVKYVDSSLDPNRTVVELLKKLEELEDRIMKKDFR